MFTSIAKEIYLKHESYTTYFVEALCWNATKRES